MRSYTITELERASQVPRSTIYYYVREGLLPTAQKAAASRAVYSEAHLDLLAAIGRLKGRGLDLRRIKAELAPRVAAAAALDVDLVADQTEQTRHSILAAAARQFARGGYKRTRIADIIKEVGVSPPVFYGHFASKRDLFVEAFGLFISWMHAFVEPQLVGEPDPIARDLARVHGFLGVQALSPDLMSLVRSEALHEEGEMRQVVERSYSYMIRGTMEDLIALREEAGVSLPAPDELVAHALLGGLENAVMRASWDDRYSTRDIMLTDLCLFLAVHALYTGRLDVREELARYADTIERLVSARPPVPPAVQ